MKPLFVALLIGACTVFAFGIDRVSAQDMRRSHTQAREKKAALIRAAEAHKQAAETAAETERQRIMQDRQSLEGAIETIRRENQSLTEQSRKLSDEIAALETRRSDLVKKVAVAETELKETVGLIRSHAKDLRVLLNQSPQSAFLPDRGSQLTPLIEQTAFPGIDHIRHITDLIFDEIRRSGEVRIQKGAIINRNGEASAADILVLGNFSAAYRANGETGFLLYSDKSRRLFALSKLPSKRWQRKIEAYMAGRSDDVPIDTARGAALRGLTHRLSLWEQVPKGGAIVWPILAIGALAILIVIERCIFLARKHVNAERFLTTVCGHIDRKDWNTCQTLCEKHKHKPIPRILLTGIGCRQMNRQDLENALQEAILNEIPGFERFMSTLGMLAAIAPLLGLLGTVTGMINTFHAITYFGTGNPRLMSGGISEALVTTMLGLSVAIPIMLAHTLLSRRVEQSIATMEEKAVSLVNLLFQARNAP